MHRLIPVVVCVSVALQCQTSPKPLSQVEACSRFMSRAVRIDVADGRATGFIVSQDGWILTAAHVVLDPQTGERRHAVAIQLPDGSSQLAQVFIDTESVIRDFALLKVEKTGLPFLELGTESEVSPGSDITIIGYPFSAESAYTASINTKFCLSGMVAATDTIVEHGVNINAIYFQGPAVKGISGGPIISRDTGHVVGIQSQKLAGIGVELNDIRKQLVAGKSNMTVRFTGVDLADSLIGIIDVMDRHLVNELGSGTGASDVAYALKKARREYERQHPRK